MGSRTRNTLWCNPEPMSCSMIGAGQSPRSFFLRPEGPSPHKQFDFEGGFSTQSSGSHPKMCGARSLTFPL